jgi:hypothetical protein
VFETPAALASADADLDEMAEADGGVALATVDWALASATGEIRQGWLPPARELVAAAMPPGALTVQAGCVLRQGELILDEDRWALRFPILPRVSAELPAERRHALDLLAADAQSRFRMIRIGWAEQSDGAALMAAVDLTGAPYAEPLILAGLEGLTQAVARLVETADILADATVPLRALEVGRWQTK